jgi:hypothetical protein
MNRVRRGRVVGGFFAGASDVDLAAQTELSRSASDTTSHQAMIAFSHLLLTGVTSKWGQ